MKPRQDLKTAAIVEASIPVVSTHGLYFAARKLFLQGVPFEVSSRVLLRSAKRRTYRPADNRPFDGFADLVHNFRRPPILHAALDPAQIPHRAPADQRIDEVAFRLDLVNRFNYMVGPRNERIACIQKRYLIGDMTRDDLEDITRLYLYVLDGVDGRKRP
jgi:hypothetical protein